MPTKDFGGYCSQVTGKSNTLFYTEIEQIGTLREVPYQESADEESYDSFENRFQDIVKLRNSNELADQMWM